MCLLFVIFSFVCLAASCGKWLVLRLVQGCSERRQIPGRLGTNVIVDDDDDDDDDGADDDDDA